MSPAALCEISKGLGSGRQMVARLKLEGIDGKAPSGAEPAACEPAACERPVVVCVGGAGGGEGERVSASIASPCVRFKTSACVPAPSPHFSYMWAWCRYTRGRFERTHGGVLNVHTGVFTCFSPCRTTPHHTHQSHTTTTNDTTTT